MEVRTRFAAVLVHAPDAEIAFVEAGFGVNRRALMYNEFSIAGPPGDPAEVKGASDPVEAFKRIAAARAPFVSRGDESGTHRKEKEIWKRAGIEPSGPWYIETGQGMGTALRVANEKMAYVLTDDATFAAVRGKVDLASLCAGSADLRNPYSIIAVNPARHPGARYAEAMALIAWLTSPEGQRAIGEFAIGGERFFHPLAVPEAPRGSEQRKGGGG